TSVSELIFSDLYRLTGKPKSSFSFLKALVNPEFRYAVIFRLTHHALFNQNRFLYFSFKILHRHYSIKYGYEINAHCRIGKGLRLVHYGGLIINDFSVIGTNCTIFKGVTIGSQRRGTKKGAPAIGNSVWIGSNAIIVGGIIIGDNVLIAPGAYVNVDVPSNSICIGNPAKIISRETATEGYIDNPC
ncbi:MAG: serine O-acetyltransferase, partial [Dysgonomonas sp.]